MQASADLVVNKPIHEVWELVTTIENLDKWALGVTEAKRTSEGEFGAGATFASKYTYRGKISDIAYVVTEFTPPSHFAVKWTSGPFPSDELWDLEPWDDGTKVTHTIHAGPTSIANSIAFALLGPIIRIYMRREVRKELEALKAYLEGE